MGSAASWECCFEGLIPGPAQWVKDPATLQLWLQLELWLGSDSWPGNSICCRTAKTKKKKKKERKQNSHFVHSSSERKIGREGRREGSWGSEFVFQVLRTVSGT